MKSEEIRRDKRCFLFVFVFVLHINDNINQNREISSKVMEVLGCPNNQCARESLMRFVWRTTRKSLEVKYPSYFFPPPSSVTFCYSF